jgi:hypothetical protein
MDAGVTGIRLTGCRRRGGRASDAGGSGIREPRGLDGVLSPPARSRGRLTATGRWLLGAMACAALMLAPPVSVAAQGQPKPSARELWEAYPLERESRTGRERADESEAFPPSAEPPQATATPVGSRTRAPERPADSGAPAPLLLGVGAAAAVALAAWLWTRRRRSAGAAVGAAPPGRPPDASAQPPAAPGPPVQARLLPEPPPDPTPWLPPDTSRAWRAEIEWNHAADASTFRVVARAPDGPSAAVIGESRPLEWPPSSAEAARALPHAVYALGDSLTRAGWRPIAPGEQWHAKRFAWEPVISRREQRDRLPPGRVRAVAGPEAPRHDAVAPARTRAGQPPSMVAGDRERNNKGKSR